MKEVNQLNDASKLKIVKWMKPVI